MKRGRPTKPSPEGFDECFRLQAYCADTIASKRSFVIYIKSALNIATANWPQLEFELLALGLSWLSTRHTLATYIKCAEYRYKLVLDDSKIATLFGWAAGSKMFNKYAKGRQSFQIESLPDLSQMICEVIV